MDKRSIPETIEGFVEELQGFLENYIKTHAFEMTTSAHRYWAKGSIENIVELAPNSDLRNLGIDSLSMIEIFLDCEETYGVTLGEDIYECSTPQEVFDKITGKKSCYDKSPTFFMKFLGESLVFSCFDWSEADNFAEAPDWNMVSILKMLGNPHHKNILDLGCGWGFNASFLGNNNRVTAVTNSKEQHEYYPQSILSDYKDVEGKFDYIVSLEAIEHTDMDEFFSYCHSHLDDGKLLFQATMDNKPKGECWVLSDIFNVDKLHTLTEYRHAWEKAGFKESKIKNLDKDYIKTYDAWLEGVDDLKYRMFMRTTKREFEQGSLSCWRILLEKSS